MLKISNDKLEQIKANVLAGIETAEKYYKEEREPSYLESYNRYYANKEYQAKFDDLSEKSKIVIRDIMNKIEWAMPSIMRLLTGTTDIVGIQGRTEEDDQPAKILKDLINWQIQRKNEGFLIFYRFVKDVLKYRFAVLKVRWERDVDENIEEIYVSSDVYQQLITNHSPEMLNQAVAQALSVSRQKQILLRQLRNIELLDTSFDEEKGLYKLKVKLTRLKSNQPVIENLLPWEFLYVPDAKSIQDVSFIAHKKRVKADYLLKKEKQGFFSNVKKALENAEVDVSELEEKVNFQEKLEYSTYSNDENLKDVDLYECYTKADIDGDGLLEDIIVWMAGGEILRIEENYTGRHPFFGASAVLESEKIEGTSLNDLIGIYQDIKTAFWKQLAINIAKNNDPITFYDPAVVDTDAISEGQKYIPVDLNNKSIKEAIQFEPTTPLSPHILPALEMITAEEENSTGITRYNQGLDAKTLNKTATGISMIMQAANQRLELIVRIISEVALRPLFRYLVELNQKYIDQETVIRLKNSYLTIRPDDLVGEFDFVVDTAIGLGTKEMQMQAMQIVGQFYPQFVQMLQVFMQYPDLYEKFRNYYKKQLELIGIKAVDEYLPTVEELQQMAQTMTQQMQAQAMQGAVNG